MNASTTDRRGGTYSGRKAGRRLRRPRLEPLEARALLAAALDDAFRVIQNQPLQAGGAGVLANDLIESGGPVSIVSNTAPAHGSLALDPDGSFTYTPAPGFSGQDTFTYTISDAGGVDVGQVTLIVVPATATRASIDAGPRLASVDSTRGALLDAVLGGLLGTSLSLDVLDWNALAQGGLNAAGFVEALRLQVGAGTTAEALTADATLLQVFDAAADAARAEGATAVADAFDALALDVAGVTGTIRLGDLLQVDPNDGSLASVGLNALDLATGAVQLFNFENAAATTSPVTVSGAALGLGSILDSVTVSAQVVEPPVHVVGPVGTAFHTAATRLRLDLDLVDVDLDASTLAADLLAPLGTLLGVAVDVDAAASVGQLSLYVEVASGDGTMTLIDAVSNAVTLQGTPGVASVFLGSLPDSLFFDRTYAVDPTDILPVVVGDLAITVTPAVGPQIATSAGLAVRALALGQAPLADSLVFNGPFPQTQTFGSSSTFIANLLSTLATNLELTLDGPLAAPVDQLVDSAILPALSPLVADAVSPVLTSVLAGLVDPALETLGVGLGEMDATVSPLIPLVPPQANDDFVVTGEDSPLTIAVLENDAAAPAGSASILSVTQPANGTVVVNADGTITYTPNPNYAGPDLFTYTITGPNGGGTSATVVLRVLAANDAPTAAPDSYSIAEDQPLIVLGPGVLANDSDPDGDPISARIATGPSHGSLALNPDGSFTYTPAPNFNGVDSFTYQAWDGATLSAPAVATIVVAAVNDAPVANPDAYATPSGQALTIPGPGVLQNDYDPDGGPIFASPASGPSNGTLSLNPDGSFTYTPNPGFVGRDSFTYSATDGAASSGPILVEISVTAGPSGGPPAAAPDAYSVAEDGVLTQAGPGVLANDGDPDGDPITARIVSGPAHGTLTLNADGSFTYRPAPNFNGSDSFVYQAWDGSSLSPPATVAISVLAVNDPPAANPDSYQTPQGGVLTVPGPGVLANDVDPDGPGLGAVLVVGPSHGTLALNPDGSFAYTPNPGFVGPDSFSYRAFDGEASSDPVAVSIGVLAASGPPRVVGIERYGFHNQPTRVSIAFSADLDPAIAQDVSNYELLGPGRDGRLGTRDDVRYGIASAAYDPAERRVTLAPSQLLLLRSSYRVVVSDRVVGADGEPLDGDGDGFPGGAARLRFDQSALAGPSVASRLPVRAARSPHRFVAAPRRMGRPAPGPSIARPAVFRPHIPVRAAGAAAVGFMR